MKKIFNHIMEKIEYFKCESIKIQIALVVNVENNTLPIDYKNIQHSILTEFLTDDEYMEILNGIRDNNLYVEPFFNENDFFKYYYKNEKNFISEEKKLVVFNLSRNGIGISKKSLIPAFCEHNNIIYTGTNAYTACLGRNKFHINSILNNSNIPVAKTWVYYNKWLTNAPPNGLKIIVKPAYEAAARGITEKSVFCYDETKNIYISEICSDFRQPIIVQEFIEGYEVQCVGIMIKNRFKIISLVGISINQKHNLGENILTYDTTFDNNYEFYKFEELSESKNNEISETAEKALEILGVENYGRVDFRISSNGEFYITDISTHPYLIKHSAFAFAFENLGLQYKDLFLYLIISSLKL